ncbi:MAG TPA: glucose 1-dehydrogenase [Spirochaetales bacterium]|nr:glucose 1-dehydrogenase [Spirochaetales bacterium]
MRLQGKVALVTGAARGIGEGISRVLSREGATVFVCDLLEKEGKETVQELESFGVKAFFFKLDVSSEESWKEAFRFVMKQAGRFDILVNNAGINIRQTIEEMEVQNLDKMLAVNVKGPFLGIKHAIPLFKKGGGGSIVNTSSICGLVGHLYTNEAYTLTKGAVVQLTKSVATRYAKFNIRCNSVAPSTVETQYNKEFLSEPQRRAERIGEIPLGRMASVEDVAEAVLYLVSPEGSFINGVILPVDGGLTAY